MAQRIVLTERDTKLLCDVYTHRYLGFNQLWGLHFVSKQTAFRRLRQLRTAGLVDAFTLPNFSHAIYRVTAKGLQVVAETLGVERSDLKWNEPQAKPKDYYFMHHFLRINDFRIRLRKDCKQLHYTLRGFIPDYVGERNDRGGMVKYVRDVICDKAAERQELSHTPDGVFAIEKDGKVALFFLEIDCGTEVVSNRDKGVLKAIRFYAQYLMDGKYQRYAKDFGVDSFKGFRALFVTTSDERRQNIRNAAATLDIPQKALQFQWIANSFRALTMPGPFGYCWLSADPNDETKYLIVK